MTQCKSCLFKEDAPDGICPVCGIDQVKEKKNLTKEEKKIRSAARGIRAVSTLHFFAGIIMLFISFLMVAIYSHGYKLIPFPEQPLANMIYYFAFGIVLLVLSAGLKKFTKWAYYTTAVSYGILLVINLINLNIGLLLIIVCPYYIWNKRARAIFNRSVPSSKI